MGSAATPLATAADQDGWVAARNEKQSAVRVWLNGEVFLVNVRVELNDVTRQQRLYPVGSGRKSSGGACGVAALAPVHRCQPQGRRSFAAPLNLLKQPCMLH
jgi:hypothetical protein